MAQKSSFSNCGFHQRSKSACDKVCQWLHREVLHFINTSPAHEPPGHNANGSYLGESIFRAGHASLWDPAQTGCAAVKGQPHARRRRSIYI